MHWNSSGNIIQAYIGDLNESHLDDFASSVIIDRKEYILASGSIKLNTGGGNQMSKIFIKKYNSSETLISTVESSQRNNNMYQDLGH